MKAIDLPMKSPEGRPSAEQTVRDWREQNPNGSKRQCKDETGLTYPTIRKWWNYEDSDN